jgi:hypothetical protein
MSRTDRWIGGNLCYLCVATIVVTAFALPLVLAHAEVIKPTACGMAIVGGALVYGTILSYTAVFKGGEDEF